MFLSAGPKDQLFLFDFLYDIIIDIIKI